MKRIFIFSILFMSLPAIGHTYWSKTISDANIERVEVVDVKSGHRVTVRTERSCVVGDDCIEGKRQFDVRLPYVSAPDRRQPFARESYLSLKDMVLNRYVLLYKVSDKSDVLIGDIATCRLTYNYQHKLAEACNLPEVFDTDIVENNNGLVSLYRDNKQYFNIKSIKKMDYPEIFKDENSILEKTRPTSRLERFVFDSKVSEAMSQDAEASVLIFFASLEQTYQGMVHVDPKYTNFDSVLYSAQDQAKTLKKGIWGLPEERQVPPWER